MLIFTSIVTTWGTAVKDGVTALDTACALHAEQSFIV